MSLTPPTLSEHKVHQSIEKSDNIFMNIFCYIKVLLFKKITSHTIISCQFLLFRNFFRLIKPKNIVRFSSCIIRKYLECPINDIDELFIPASIMLRQYAHLLIIFLDLFFRSRSFHFFTNKISYNVAGRFIIFFIRVSTRHISVAFVFGFCQ